MSCKFKVGDIICSTDIKRFLIEIAKVVDVCYIGNNHTEYVIQPIKLKGNGWDWKESKQIPFNSEDIDRDYENRSDKLRRMINEL